MAVDDVEEFPCGIDGELLGGVETDAAVARRDRIERVRRHGKSHDEGQTVRRETLGQGNVWGRRVRRLCGHGCLHMCIDREPMQE